MSTAFAATIPGPSLPPNVDGEIIGTLTICFQNCSLVGAFARIQFWGETKFSHLYPKQCRRSSDDTGALHHPHIGIGNEDRLGLLPVGGGESAVVKYPLVGSISDLCKYLKDASPLQVIFSRHQTSTSSAQPEFLGCASIRDIGIAEVLTLQSVEIGTPKTINISLRREVQVSKRPDVNSSTVVGEALFELTFQVLTPTATSHLRSDSKVQTYAKHQSITTNQRNDPSSWTQARQSQVCCSYIHDSDSTQSLVDETIGFHSGLCSIYDEEKQSLLEELLDLCTDDMTIPTLCSANTAFDPYDMWISRMIANASSPPAKEFPSLASAGSRQSNILRMVGLLRIEIYELTLISRVAKRIKGKHDFSLQYDPPPHACTDIRQSSIEFTVCKQFGTQNRTKSARRTHPTFTKNESIQEDNRDIPLLTSHHTKHMEIMFKDENSVSHWLEGVVEFRLFACASKPTDHPQLPRVAKLADNKKMNAVTTPGKICLARACLRLRTIVLSDTLASDAKLDLVFTKNTLIEENNGKVGGKIGSLSVRLGLHPGDKCSDQSSPCSQTNLNGELAKAGENMQILIKEAQSPLSLTPHPISVLLSTFAGASSKLDRSPPSGNRQQFPQQNGPHSADIDTKENQTQRGSLPQQANEKQTSDDLPRTKGNVQLKPVKAPPVWLDIQIQSISNLRVDAVRGKSGSLCLSMSCNKPLLPLGKVTQLQSDSNDLTRSTPLGSEIPSQEIAKLRNRCSSVSLKTVHSWQVALEAEHSGDKCALLTLHLCHCSSSGDEPLSQMEDTFIGFAKIPFLCEPTIDLQQKICNWLPNIAVINWFNIIDPKSKNSIGRIQVMVAVGMLRQIRGFANTCNSTLKIQRWWRKIRAKTKKPIELPGERNHCVANHNSPLRERSPRNDGDLLHTSILTRTDDQASSPDSLFEEWSQQSLSVTDEPAAKSIQSGVTIVDKPAAKYMQKTRVSSNFSALSDEVTGIYDDTASILATGEELKAPNTIENCIGADIEQIPCKLVHELEHGDLADSPKTSGCKEVTGLHAANLTENFSVEQNTSKTMPELEYGDTVDKPLVKCTQQKIPTSAVSPKTSGCDELTNGTASILSAEVEAKAADITENCNGADMEQNSCKTIPEFKHGDTNIVEETAAKYTQEKNPAPSNCSKTSEAGDTEQRAEVEQYPCKNAVDQFEVIVHLEKINGLQETLSKWTRQQGNSDKTRLLSVSGVFVSYSITQESTAMSQQEELQKLCLGRNVWHSNLVLADTIDRDIELDLETATSVPNHEKNTDMILAQVLQFKLWFVPIITTTIDRMINTSTQKDMRTLNGCRVISTADCPLYHLYTSQGCYSGRVPWNIDIHGIGCIWTSVHRWNVKNKPLRSVAENSLKKVCADQNMSILKPLNLEDSFSRRQCNHTQSATGVDPPEEIKNPDKTSSSKRKLENRFVGRSQFKRYRCVENLEAATTGGNKSSREVEDTPTYHSLTSVMESLENINTKLQQVSSFTDPVQKTVSQVAPGSACPRRAGGDDPPADTTRRRRRWMGSEGRRSPHGADGGAAAPPARKPGAGTPASDAALLPRGAGMDPCLNSIDEDLGYNHAGRQMEPPEEVVFPETPTGEVTKSSASILKTKTVEKGSSPMSVYHCAASSPCGECLVDDGRLKDAEEETNDYVHQHGKKYVNKLKLNCSRKKGDCKPTDINQKVAGLPSEKMLQRIKQSIRRRENEKAQSQSTHGHLIHPFLHNNTGQTRHRMLSPVLDSICPTQGAFLARNRRFFPDNISPKEQSQIRNSPIADRKNNSSLLFDKERLERIFLSQR